MAVLDSPLSTRLAAFSNQPGTRQLALLLGLAASIAVGFGLVQWASTPAYKPLFGALAGEDTSRAIASLESQGIDYRLDNRSGLLAVAADQVQRARIVLASEGLPGSAASGFESLYQEQEIGVSSFMERARFHRALERELAATIAALDSVRSARVHLAEGRQSAFLRQRDNPAASVVLHLYAGQSLSRQQLAGVVNLVSSSMPNLAPESVAVVDQQGRLLSGQGEDTEFGYTREQFQLAELIEQRYSDRISRILEPILGPGAVRAQVSADIDFTRVERTREEYAPETVVRSEQTSEAVTAGAAPEGGIPGALMTQPPAETEILEAAPGTAASETATANTNRSVLRNYEIDRTISHIRETPGSIRKLSVALVVDYAEQTAEDGSVARVPLSDERLAEISELVQDAIGFDATRGDTVSVINASFVQTDAAPEPVVSAPLLERPWVWDLARWLAVALGLILLMVFVIRPLIRFSTSAQASLPSAGGARALPAENQSSPGGVEGELADDRVTLGGDTLALSHEGYQRQLEKARNVVDEEPRRAAHVMKQWVAENG